MADGSPLAVMSAPEGIRFCSREVTECQEIAKVDQSSGNSTAKPCDTDDMPPWEQHGGVINMPRFLYGASIALLQRSNPGFLITCTYRREKSATKEAMTLLHEYLQTPESVEAEMLSGADSICHKEPSKQGIDAIQKMKRVKSEVCGGSDNVGPLTGKNAVARDVGRAPQTGVGARNLEAKTSQSVEDVRETFGGPDVPQKGGKVTPERLLAARSDQGHIDAQKCAARDREIPEFSSLKEQSQSGFPELFLVKLARMGLIYMSVSGRTSREIVAFVSKLLADIQTGSRSPPVWCHRILPVQATCPLTKDDLHAVVVKLVREHLEDHEISRDHPLKYAVVFNRRGVEDKHIASDSINEGSLKGGAFAKTECIRTVTEAVRDVTPHTTVDLTSPQMVVIVEVLPMVGAQCSLICAVTVLPRDLVNTKPRLSVVPLACSKKRKQCG